MYLQRAVKIYLKPCHPHKSRRSLTEDPYVFHRPSYFSVSGAAFTYPPVAQRWQKPGRAGNRGTGPSAPLLRRAFSAENKWAVCQLCAHLGEGQEPPKPRPCVPSCPSWSRGTSCLVERAASRNKNNEHIFKTFLRTMRIRFSFWKRIGCTNSRSLSCCVFWRLKSETKCDVISAPNFWTFRIKTIA